MFEKYRNIAIGVSLRGLILEAGQNLDFRILDGATGFLDVLRKLEGSKIFLFGIGGKNFRNQAEEWCAGNSRIIRDCELVVCNTEKDCAKKCAHKGVNHFIAPSSQASLFSVLEKTGMPQKRPACHRIKPSNGILDRKDYQVIIEKITKSVQ